MDSACVTEWANGKTHLWKKTAAGRGRRSTDQCHKIEHY